MKLRPPSLLLLTMVGVLLAVATALRQEGMFFRDGAVYMGLADLVRSGDLGLAIRHPHHPLTSWGIALFWKLTGSAVVAGRLWSLLGLALACLGLHGLVSRLWSKDAAGWSVLFALLLPHAMIFGTDILSDPMYWGGVLMGSSLLLAAATDKHPALAVAAGMFYGVAYLSRPEGLVMAGIALMIVLVMVVRRRVPVSVLIAGALGLVLMASPFVLLLKEHHGTWRLSLKVNFIEMAGLSSFVGPSAAGHDFLKVDGAATDNTVDEWGEMTASSERWRYAFKEQMGGFASTAGATLLFLLVSWSWWRREWRRAWPLWALAAVQLLMLEQQWFEDHYLSKRHWMPVALALTGLVGPMFLSWQQTRPRLCLVVLVLTGLVALDRDLMLTKSTEKRRKELRVACRELGVDVSGHGGTLLVCKDVRTAWFAGKRHIDWPINENPLSFVDRLSVKFGSELLVAVPKRRPHRDEKWTHDALKDGLVARGWRTVAESELETVMEVTP